MTDMNKWLRDYDRFRTNPFDDVSEEWKSTKFDISGMNWQEVSDIELDLLDQNGDPMRFAQACSALKKTWTKYKLSGKDGQYRGDLAYRINEIQEAMGIPLTMFDHEDDEDWGQWEAL